MLLKTLFATILSQVRRQSLSEFRIELHIHKAPGDKYIAQFNINQCKV